MITAENINSCWFECKNRIILLHGAQVKRPKWSRIVMSHNNRMFATWALVYQNHSTHVSMAIGSRTLLKVLQGLCRIKITIDNDCTVINPSINVCVNAIQSAYPMVIVAKCP